MQKFGLRLQKANLRKVTSLRRRTSLILLRWQWEPTQMHALVFDGSTGSIIDPSFSAWQCTMNDIQYNLDSIYYVNRKNIQPVARSGHHDLAIGSSDHSSSLAV